MKTIWKYELKPGRTELLMPEGAQVLTVQTQGDRVQLWALLDPDAGRASALHQRTRTFMIYGTGHDLPTDPGKYLATFQFEGGALVFHAFELGTP